MNRLRGALLAVLLWCAVVAAVSILVWVVISRAGQGVVPVAQPRVDVTGSLPVPAGDDRSQRTSPGVTLSPRPSRSTAAPSTRATTSSPPLSNSAPPSPITPDPQRRSWSGTSGHIVAECRGSSAELVSAFPNAGWRYAIGSRGPQLVRVRFQRLGEDRLVTVAARCLAGVPHFSTLVGETGDD